MSEEFTDSTVPKSPLPPESKASRPILAQSMPAPSLDSLRAAFRGETLSREDFWSAMKEQHRQLLRYSELIGEGEIERIEINRDGLAVEFRSGLKMRWDPEDTRSVPSFTVNHGHYEPEEVRVLAALAERSRVVLDIGSNAGFMALNMARAGAEQVHAFEPVPSTFDELTRNVELNQLGAKICCHALALGEREETADFYVPVFHGSVAASARPLFPEQENTIVPVPVVPLDRWVAEQEVAGIDLVKCDVEGAELFVLRGGLATLGQHKPVLMVELLRKWAAVYGYHPNEVIQLLAPLGYRAYVYQEGEFQALAAITSDTRATNFFFFAEGQGRELRERIAAVVR